MEPFGSICNRCMDLSVDIGQRLRAEREALGLSQSEFAAIAAGAGVPGATRQSQALYEKGKRSPDSGYMTAIAAAGVDICFVLTGFRLAAHVRRNLQAAARATLDASVTDEERARLHELFVESAAKGGVATVLTAEEQALIDNFRHAGADGKKAITATSAAMVKALPKKGG